MQYATWRSHMKPTISLHISLIQLFESVGAKIHNFCVVEMMYYIVSGRFCPPN